MNEPQRNVTLWVRRLRKSETGLTLRAAVGRVSAKAATQALGGTVAGSIPGFILPFAVAAHFGIGRETDAYVFAFAVASFGLALCISVIEQNVLPVASEKRRLGSLSFSRFARRTALQAAVVGLSIGGGIGLIAARLVAARHGWSAWERSASEIAIVLFVPLISLAAVNSAVAGCLYAYDDFVSPTMSQSLRAVVPALGLVALGTSHRDVEVLAALVTCGEGCRVPVLAMRLAICVRRADPQAGEELTARSAAPRGNAATRGIWRAAAPAGLGILAVSINPVVDRYFASGYGSGATTLLDLGEKIFYVPSTLIQAGIVLVAGARWAKLLSIGQTERLGPDFRRSLRLVLIVALCLGVLAILATEAALRSGEILDQSRAHQLILIVIFLMLGLPGTGSLMLCGRLVTVLQETRWLPFLAAQAVFVNCLGDYVGGKLDGVVGIALCSGGVWSINGILMMVLALQVQRRRARGRLHPSPAAPR